MVNAQEWLDQNYPKNGKCKRKIEDDHWWLEVNDYGKTRTEIIKLDIKEQNLEGELVLSDFVNLEELDCSRNNLNSIKFSNLNKLKVICCFFNQLTNINLSGIVALKILNCSDNYLTNLNSLLENCNPKIEVLNLSTNNFVGDLTPLSKFSNLKVIWISSNSLTGSLKPLQNLTNLKKLSIFDTDIDSDLEYLPEKLERFNCSAGEKIPFNQGIFEKELRSYGRPDGGVEFIHLLKLWRQANQSMIDLINSLANLRLALDNQVINDELTDKTLQIFIFETEQKILAWRKERKEQYQTQIIQLPPQNH